MSCPRCFGTEWKLASLVYAEGLSGVASRARGGGLAVGTAGIGAAMGGARTSGTQQSVLSALAAPPKRRMPMTILWVSLLVLFGLGAINSRALFPFLIVATCILGLAYFFPKERLRNAKKKRRYAVTRFCLRCGTFYFEPSDLGGKDSTSDRSTIADWAVALILLAVVVILFLLAARFGPS